MLSEVKGQDDAVRYLRRMVEGRYTSPLLLVGEDGVGRRFSAMQAIVEMFCKGERAEGCTCRSCKQIAQEMHPDLTVITPADGKDIGVADVRSIVEDAQTYPSTAPVRVFLVDGADRFTTPAANAFLKTLEEPPDTTRFLLIASSPDEVIPTIRSRCGIVQYRRLPEAFIISMLSRFESDPVKALVYARLADGSAGRAIRLWGSGQIRLRDQFLGLVKSGFSGDAPALFSGVDDVASDMAQGMRFLEHLLHDLLMVQHDPDKLINRDIESELRAVRARLRPGVLERFATGLKELQRRQKSAAINVPFHLKTLLLQSSMPV